MVKIRVTQQDIDDSRCVANRYKGSLCDSVLNPVSFAIQHQCEHTTTFIDWQHIQVVREQSYWLAVPDEVKKWLNTFNQYLILKTQFELSTTDKRNLENMEAELVPFEFTLDLPTLSAKDKKAAILRKEKHLAKFAEEVTQLSQVSD